MGDRDSELHTTSCLRLRFEQGTSYVGRASGSGRARPEPLGNQKCAPVPGKPRNVRLCLGNIPNLCPHKSCPCQRGLDDNKGTQCRRKSVWGGAIGALRRSRDLRGRRRRSGEERTPKREKRTRRTEPQMKRLNAAHSLWTLLLPLRPSERSKSAHRSSSGSVGIRRSEGSPPGGRLHHPTEKARMGWWCCACRCGPAHTPQSPWGLRCYGL